MPTTVGMAVFSFQQFSEYGSHCSFISYFSTPGLVQKIDQRLPVANEYLLLSGGAREGVLDLNPEDLGDYAKGADFDLDFTLLVPALKLHDRNQPVTLDMRHSPPCHSWLSLRLCDSNILSRWNVCCQEENGQAAEEDAEEAAEISKRQCDSRYWGEKKGHQRRSVVESL